MHLQEYCSKPGHYTSLKTLPQGEQKRTLTIKCNERNNELCLGFRIFMFQFSATAQDSSLCYIFHMISIHITHPASHMGQMRFSILQHGKFCFIEIPVPLTNTYHCSCEETQAINGTASIRPRTGVQSSDHPTKSTASFLLACTLNFNV